MKTRRKLFGNIDLTWKKVIIFAIITGIYTAIMAMLPIAKDTSFADITVTFEVWILFGILIIMNSKSAKDSALKCFIFFLISQPLVYVIQDVINHTNLFYTYYRNWIIWTIATLPMGFLGWYLKKDKWWGLLILVPVLLLLGYHFRGYLGTMMYSFPKHILTTAFCAITIILYPLVIFKDKKLRISGLIIGSIMLVVFTFLAIGNPQKYETEILCNGGSDGAVFDNTYKVYLSNESFGSVEIMYIEQLEDWAVHAIFNKTGDTELIVESPNGEKQIFNIHLPTGNVGQQGEPNS